MSRASSARVEDRIVFHFNRSNQIHRDENFKSQHSYSSSKHGFALSVQVATKSLSQPQGYSVKLAVFQNKTDSFRTLQSRSTLVTVHKWSVHVQYVLFDSFPSLKAVWKFDQWRELLPATPTGCFVYILKASDHGNWRNRSFDSYSSRTPQLWIRAALASRQCCLAQTDSWFQYQKHNVWIFHMASAFLVSWLRERARNRPRTGMRGPRACTICPNSTSVQYLGAKMATYLTTRDTRHDRKKKGKTCPTSHHSGVCTEYGPSAESRTGKCDVYLPLFLAGITD